MHVSGASGLDNGVVFFSPVRCQLNCALQKQQPDSISGRHQLFLTFREKGQVEK